MEYSFSQRNGLKSVKNVIQVNSMDQDLRNGLWNLLEIRYLDLLRDPNPIWDFIYEKYEKVLTLLNEIWFSFFKEPLDTMPNDSLKIYNIIRKYFFDAEWYEVYDFIEFVANNYPDDNLNKDFMEDCNLVLKRELSGYRFVGGKITPITAEEEISEIEESLERSETLKGVNIHLKTALDLLSNRESPDYRNSIKESISAVEAICRIIAGDEKATIGKALDTVSSVYNLHPALKKAFNNLYGYTSDADGIRHSLLDEPNVDFEDAKFMLVVCCAFVNYMISKMPIFGIE